MCRIKVIVLQRSFAVWIIGVNRDGTYILLCRIFWRPWFILNTSFLARKLITEMLSFSYSKISIWAKYYIVFAWLTSNWILVSQTWGANIYVRVVIHIVWVHCFFSLLITCLWSNILISFNRFRLLLVWWILTSYFKTYIDVLFTAYI